MYGFKDCAVGPLTAHKSRDNMASGVEEEELDDVSTVSSWYARVDADRKSTRLNSSHWE